MYDKILVPTDTSSDSEDILPMVQGLLNPGGEGILMHIIPPGRTKSSGQFVLLASQVEETMRAEAMTYLIGVVHRLAEVPGQWRCEAIVSDSVADGIVSFARRQEVDLIADVHPRSQRIGQADQGEYRLRKLRKSILRFENGAARELVAR